jgi:hypothetical protein
VCLRICNNNNNNNNDNTNNNNNRATTKKLDGQNTIQKTARTNEERKIQLRKKEEGEEDETDKELLHSSPFSCCGSHLGVLNASVFVRHKPSFFLSVFSFFSFKTKKSSPSLPE